MTDRRKTVLILGMTSLFMFSPLAMSLFWHPIPLFQDLGFERGSIAPPLAWSLATIIAIAYVLYTMKAIPLVIAKQKEISLFKLLGILSALVGGIVEEVFFRRWHLRNQVGSLWMRNCPMQTSLARLCPKDVDCQNDSSQR